MKLKQYYEKQLKAAADHWDEHPVSGSAKRKYLEWSKIYNQYLARIYEYESTRSNRDLEVA
jgi:hypothetical protein